jgi:hypothetical protein
VLHDFGGRWKASIEAMHKEVLGQVADAACAREVLQVGQLYAVHISCACCNPITLTRLHAVACACTSAT